MLQHNKREDSISEGLYVAVSLSMPRVTLERLYKEVTKAGGKLIIRGLKNNSFTETVEVVKALSDEGIAIDINPGIFTKYRIERVPYFVLISDNGEDSILGNISLSYVLEEFKRAGETKEEVSRCLAKLSYR